MGKQKNETTQRKLLRPLHRQRNRRRSRAAVLNSAELQQLFNVSQADLVQYLEQNGIGYHRDSSGEIWVSQELNDPPVPPPPHTL